MMTRTMFWIGDKVTVVRNGSDWEYWVPGMDKTVGCTGEVVGFEDDIDDTIYAIVGGFEGIDGKWFYKDEYLRLVANEPAEEISSEMSVMNLVSQFGRGYK